MRNIKHHRLAVTEWWMGGLFAIVPRSGSSLCRSHLVVMRVSYSRCCPRGKSLSLRILEDQFSSPCPCPWVSSPWQQHWSLFVSVVSLPASTQVRCHPWNVLPISPLCTDSWLTVQIWKHYMPHIHSAHILVLQCTWTVAQYVPIMF